MPTGLPLRSPTPDAQAEVARRESERREAERKAKAKKQQAKAKKAAAAVGGGGGKGAGRLDWRDELADAAEADGAEEAEAAAEDGDEVGRERGTREGNGWHWEACRSTQRRLVTKMPLLLLRAHQPAA